MSQINIQRKRTESLRVKLHSQQSRNLKPRQSLNRILNDSISKRRKTTHNSPQHSQDLSTMQNEIEEAKQIYKNKNTKNALALFRALYKKYPNNSQIPYFLGSCLLNQGNFDTAIIYFRVCLSNDSNFNKNVFLYMAICYKAQQKLKQALDVLESAIQKYPRFKDAHFYKGKIHMKIKEYEQAATQFKKCLKLEPKDNQLCYLLLGDCLRNLNRNQEATQQYNKVMEQKSKYYDKAIVKKVGLLIDQKKMKEAYKYIKVAASKNIDCAQLTFFKGLCQYEMGNFNDAITFFELSITSNVLPQTYINKSLIYLIQISIILKDFFGAQHLISRSKLMNTNQQQLKQYYKLVEGINDLIKKRLNQSQEKLQLVYKNSQKQKQDYQSFLFQASAPYYAYSLFSLQKYQMSLQVYKNYLKNKTQNKKLQQYNKLICQGIILHKSNQFREAQNKWNEASTLIPNKVEPKFLISINLVQQNRKKMEDKNIQAQVISKLKDQFKAVEKITPPNPLFLFYYSLVLLYQGEDACSIIDQAINCSEQEISQYFFIEALSYSLAGNNLKGLQMITKAIQLDQNIPEFYKERSKYFYVLQQYEQAVTDIVKVLDQSNDEQGKLLLTFYYYMTNQYPLSLDLLNQISQQCTQDKFKQFQMALRFRVHQLDKCGVIGLIVNAIQKQQKLPQEFIDVKMKTCIQHRQSYSEFTVYHLHLLMSAYFFYNDQLDRSLQHLFGALQEIQINSQADQQYATISQEMLNQIKFNIAITSLQKQSKQPNFAQQNSLQDTVRYIQMFISQTQNIDFIKTMNSILKTIDPKRRKKHSLKNQDPELIKVIQMQSEIIKLSQCFPEMCISLGQKISLKVKFMVMYPPKLKFNITPQFDESFLFNFDIDKVESKLCPPWFKLHQGHIFFTDKIRNQSVLISETDRAPTPSSLILAPSPAPQNLKQKFKLDEIVQKKLQKLIQGRKRKTQQSQKKTSKLSN